MKRVLFLCTENSCRSQMAEALANHFLGDRVYACSAGVRPKGVHPLAIKVLNELGIDTSCLRSKSVDEFEEEHFDMVVTLCDSAREECPFFPNASEVVHLPFPDPSVEGTLEAFRKVRDMILERLRELFNV